MTQFLIQADPSEWTMYGSEEEFLRAYPPEKWGEYRPQPDEMPDSYPVLVRDLGVIPKANSADLQNLVYEYDFIVLEKSLDLSDDGGPYRDDSRPGETSHVNN